MAGTNRNRKLPLSEAWKHYWSVLFPNGIDWQTDLEAEIKEHLCFPGEAEVFSRKRPERGIPTWTNDLAIRIRDNAVGIEFKNTEFGTIPLFVISNLVVLSNWRGKSPLVRVGTQSILTDRDKEQCQGLIHTVIRTCGNRIQNRLLRVIKETERPEFEIYCRPKGDVFAEEKRLPVMGLSDVVGIDIVNNELTDGMRSPIYSYVQIKRKKHSNPKAGPSGSFHEQDAALIEKMKSLIDTRMARSVRQAALAVLSKAPRRGNASDDSVELRLRKKFSQKYPDYSNRHD